MYSEYPKSSCSSPAYHGMASHQDVNLGPVLSPWGQPAGAVSPVKGIGVAPVTGPMVALSLT
jgi:hypothetical protein